MGRRPTPAELAAVMAWVVDEAALRGARQIVQWGAEAQLDAARKT